MPTLFITIDTEEDLWGEYRSEKNPVMNVAQLPGLQQLFDQYGAIPTYLVNWAVVSDDAACSTVRHIANQGRCEIGMHCHPWNTPPFKEKVGAYNSMLCNLSPELVRDKLSNLHALISSRLATRSVTFRAGRWGFSEDIARSIVELGYTVDTSVSPTVNWSQDHGPDFTGALVRPYRLDPSDIYGEKPDGDLLEVPPTIGFWQKNHFRQLARQERLSKGLSKQLHVLGILDRMHLLNNRWLSPEQSPGSDMIKLAKSTVREGIDVLNMFFHSNSLLPGATPFARDVAERDRLLDRIRVFLAFAVENGYKFAPLSRAANDRGLL
jgi:hypothetical protein